MAISFQPRSCAMAMRSRMTSVFSSRVLSPRPRSANARSPLVNFTNGDLAFADRGRGLITRLENTEVIRDLIAIAQERGWNDIAIRGTERFRKEAWQQANLARLTVRGYRPSELERAQLARLVGRERDDGREASTPTPAPSDRPATRRAMAEEG